MIPKIIHYCWFGGAPMSPFILRCMATWSKVLPDYRLKLWSEDNFDVNTLPFVRDAYRAGKWAFVADYVRLYALYNEGGIYMDTDVKVMRSFDEFLTYNFFSSHEVHPQFYDTESMKLNEDMSPKSNDQFVDCFGIHSAVMGSVAGLPYIRDCMEQYANMSFYSADGTLDMQGLIIGRYITREAYKYGYRFVDEDQLLKDNMMIKRSDIFVGNMLYLSEKSYAIHLCNGSWLNDNKDWRWHLRSNHPQIYSFISPFLRIWSRVCRVFQCR